MRSRPTPKDLELCRYCPSLCQSRCPVNLALADIAWSPCGKMSGVWRLQEGLVKATREATIPLHMCLDCLACREVCDHGVEVPDNLAGARLAADTHYAQTQNPVDTTWNTQKAWETLRSCTPAWRCVDEAAVLLVPGREMLEPEGVDQLKALFQVLDKLSDEVVGVNPDSVLDDGHFSYIHGNLAQAKTAAGKAFKRYGKYKRIVVASPHNLSFVTLHWPQLGYDRSKSVMGVIEYLSSAMDWNHSARFDGRVAWHDPCHLGRHLEQYQLPRDLLKWAGRYAPVELLHNHGNSLCCGGGYPMSTRDPDGAARVTAMRVAEIDASEADVVVTGCSQCVHTLREANPEKPIKHLVEFLAEVL